MKVVYSRELQINQLWLKRVYTFSKPQAVIVILHSLFLWSHQKSERKEKEKLESWNGLQQFFLIQFYAQIVLPMIFVNNDMWARSIVSTALFVGQSLP